MPQMQQNFKLLLIELLYKINIAFAFAQKPHLCDIALIACVACEDAINSFLPQYLEL